MRGLMMQRREGSNCSNSGLQEVRGIDIYSSVRVGLR